MKASRLIQLLQETPDAEVVIEGKPVGAIGLLPMIKRNGGYEADTSWGKCALEEGEKRIQAIEIRRAN
jgi:hypothetical protein